MQYSRLSKRYDRLNKQQSYLLIIGSIALLVIFIAFGFPAILGLSAQISQMHRGDNASQVDKGLAPTTPKLSLEFDATNSANIKLAGIADPSVTVELFQNNQSQTTAIASQDGTFKFDVSLVKGDNAFSVQATSNSGVKSNRSENYVITYLATRPKLDITSPKDGDTVKDSRLIVNGKTDPGDSVTINDHLVITASDGNFSGIISLSNGDNKIKTVANDRAGNQTTKEITVRYQP